MDKNTQQPAWWHARINGAHDGFFDELPPDDAYDEGTLTALYTAPPVPRDVLMEFGEAVREQTLETAWQIGKGKLRSAVDLAALADRYASQAHPDRIAPDVMDALVGNDGGRKPETVNQQMLAAMMLALPFVEDHEDSEIYKAGAVKKALNTIRAAIAAAEAAQPVEQQYLLGGRRFKVTHSQDHGFAITGLPQTMNGQWVAFVDATDNCHMQQPPASAQPVAVPDGYVLVPIDPTSQMCRAGTRAWSQDQQWLTAPVSIYSAMLSAAPKPEGV